MKEENQYYVLAFYLFTDVEDPVVEVQRHKDFFFGRDVKSRIYIARDGINGQMSAFEPDAKLYMEWIKQHKQFRHAKFKIHYSHEHVFPRLTVKEKKQLVAMDCKVDYRERSSHVSPHEWKEMLERRDNNTLLIDVRNDYESKIGHFDGAILPPLKTFRQFPAYVDQVKKEVNPDQTKIMMYCTGGIRCELYSVLFQKAGFKRVYQLDGGVIQYGLTVGSDYWKGRLFVFDDRLAVPLVEGEEPGAISHCFHCSQPCDTYLNCANSSCNALFLCCLSCAEKKNGCCSTACLNSGKLRMIPVKKEGRPKPFRKKTEEERKFLETR